MSRSRGVKFYHHESAFKFDRLFVNIPTCSIATPIFMKLKRSHSRFIQYCIKAGREDLVTVLRRAVVIMHPRHVDKIYLPSSLSRVCMSPSEIVKLHYVLNVYHYYWILIIHLVFILDTNLLHYPIILLVGVPAHLVEIQWNTIFDLWSFELIQHYLNVHKNILEFKEILNKCI